MTKEKVVIRIHASTKCGASFFAVTATTICYVERHHDAVSFLEEGDAGAGLEDYAHVFMS